MESDKKNLSFSKQKSVLILLGFWLIYILFDYITIGLVNLTNGNSFFEAINLFASIMYIVQLITIFIIYFFIAPYFLKNINWKSILFSIICSFTTFIIVRYFIEQIITDFLFHKVNYFEGTTISFYIYDNLHYGSFIVFSSLFYG